jgi:hypothetical protein
MRTRNSAWPPLVWVLSLFVMVWAAMATACGSAKYAEAAHATAVPGIPGEAYAASDDGYARTEQAEYAPEVESPPAPAPPEAPMMEMSGSAMPMPAKMAQNAPQPEPAPSTKPSDKAPKPTVASDAIPIQQVLIYTAQLSMAVFQVDKALGEVETLARNLGGFLSHRTDTQITIRVPAAQFDEALKGIAGMGDVLTRNVQVEDVTEEYLDVTLRLKNARQVRERIAQLLANAKNVEESLEVERELHRLSAEIERLEGRLKYLSNKAQYSTITVTFRPEQVDDVRPAFQLPFPWLRELGLGRLMNLR